MKKLEYFAAGGETNFSNPLLIGKTILSVEKDGIGYTKIITTGAPTDKHILYTNYTGTLSFASQMTPGEYVLVLYQDNGSVCFPTTIQSGFTLPDATAALPYNASFFINGTLPFSISSIIKPSWLTVTLSGNQVIFSGTPSISDAGSNSVSFTLTNTCGTANFSQSFNVVVPAAQFDPATYVSGDRLTLVEIANISGTNGVIVTVTLDTLTNSNGGTLKVNGSLAFIGNTWNVTLGASGGTLNIEIDGIAAPGTVILGHFTITAVSAGAIGLLKTYQTSKVF